MKKILLKIKFTPSNKAFTLVETLVAISILMLSVTGPLYFATESLKAATYARDQITAFYLAQDAFEQIRKIRDDNYQNKKNPWYSGLNNCPSSLPCVVNSVGNFYDLGSSYGLDYYLYRNDMEGDKKGVYSHDKSNGQTKTPFERKVIISATDPTNPSSDLWAGSTEIKVTVKIIWNSRGIAREFEAYEFLRNFSD